MHDTASRFLYFNIGLLLSLVLVYVAFSWTVEGNINNLPKQNLSPEVPGVDEYMEFSAPEEIAVPSPTEPVEQPTEEKAETVEAVLKPEKINTPVPEVKEEAKKNELLAGTSSTPEGSEPAVEGEIFAAVDVRPVPEPGWEAFNTYLKTSLKYPEVAKQNKKTGKVFVQFVVDKSGNVRDVQLLRRGLGLGCDEEAIRLIKNSPKWIPGKKNGIPVNTRLIWPVEFQLQEK